MLVWWDFVWEGWCSGLNLAVSLVDAVGGNDFVHIMAEGGVYYDRFPVGSFCIVDLLNFMGCRVLGYDYFWGMYGERAHLMYGEVFFYMGGVGSEAIPCLSGSGDVYFEDVGLLFPPYKRIIFCGDLNVIVTEAVMWLLNEGFTIYVKGGDDLGCCRVVLECDVERSFLSDEFYSSLMWTKFGDRGSALYLRGWSCLLGLFDYWYREYIVGWGSFSMNTWAIMERGFLRDYASAEMRQRLGDELQELGLCGDNPHAFVEHVFRKWPV